MASVNSIQPGPSGSKGPGIKPSDENIFVIKKSRKKVHPIPQEHLELENFDLNQPDHSDHRHHLKDTETSQNSNSNNDSAHTVEGQTNKQHKSFLKIFVKCAPYLLLRPFRNEDKITNKYALVLQRILFVIFNVLAYANTLGNIKYHILQKDEMNVLRFYAVLLYYMNNLILRLCCMYITCFKWNGLFTLTKTSGPDNEKKPNSTIDKRTTVVVVALVIVSFAVAFANPLVEAGTSSNWDGDDMIQHHADTIVVKVFKWDNAKLTRDEIRKYEPTPKTSFLWAFTEVTMEFTGDIQLHLILDLALTAAMTMHGETQVLTEKIKQSKPSDHKDPIKTKAVYFPYKALRSYHQTLDATFNFTLQFLLLDNLLFCVYMAYSHGLAETSALLVILDLLNLVKIIWFIVSSVRSAVVNDVFRGWVQTSFPSDGLSISADEPKVTIPVLLDQINNDPIGVGSSIFFMNRGFIYGFIRTVVSATLFLFNLDGN